MKRDREELTQEGGEADGIDRGEKTRKESEKNKDRGGIDTGRESARQIQRGKTWREDREGDVEQDRGEVFPITTEGGESR
jgi:hypothetical protein